MTTKLMKLFFAALVALSAYAFDPVKDIGLSVTRGELVVQIPTGVHLKKEFMEVNLSPGQKGSVRFGKLPAVSGQDEVGEAIWRGTLRMPLVMEGVSGPVKLVVTYQPCTEGDGGSCFPPTDRTLTVPASELSTSGALVASPVPNAEVSKTSTQATQPEVATGPETSSGPVELTAPIPSTGRPSIPSVPDKGLLFLLLIAFGAGLAASLTPCVYPMIPITMAVIGAKGGGKAKGFSLSLALVLGMAVTYTALGVVAAKTGAAFGAFAQRPGFLIPVSVIFTLFALSLFGAFEISLPSSIQNKLQGSGSRKGYFGAFVMGLVLGPLAAPCVGPVVGSVLVGIAQKGDVVMGGLQLFVFSLGMGVLFMLAGTFSASLPRSGDWLTRLKYGMGLVVLGFAAWNVRLIVPEWINFAMWSTVSLVAASVMGVFEGAEGLLGHLRRVCSLLALLLGLLLGLRGIESALDLRLLSGGGVAEAAPKAEDFWMSQDLEGALRKAKAENKLVLVDIYAEWCAQCKELDHKTWPDADVKAWIAKNVIAIRIDTDKQRPDLAKRLEVRSYPSVILLDAEGKEQRRILGFQKPKEMLGFLGGATR